MQYQSLSQCTGDTAITQLCNHAAMHARRGGTRRLSPSQSLRLRCAGARGGACMEVSQCQPIKLFKPLVWLHLCVFTVCTLATCARASLVSCGHPDMFSVVSPVKCSKAAAVMVD